MSRNLHLTSRNNGSIPLIQTPTRITDEAMKFYDRGDCGRNAARHALQTYKNYLETMGWMDKEELELTIEKMETFLAFALGARFEGY